MKIAEKPSAIERFDGIVTRWKEQFYLAQTDINELVLRLRDLVQTELEVNKIKSSQRIPVHIRLQPEVESERKHGKWIKLSETWYGEHCMTTYACDQCGHDRQFIGPYMAAYCENCGAIMEGCDDNG